MRQPAPVMKLWLLVVACTALLPVRAAEGTASRFSQMVGTEERAAVGLAKLSSDQLAALDALVRRDTATRGAVNADGAAPAAFSQRLTSDERRVTGLTLLTPEELAKLDAAVERHASATLARALLAPPVYASRKSRVEPTETKAKPEIHGSLSLSYGWGKGGYSEKTGAMVVTVDDPSRRFGLTIGYAQTEVKGGDGVRLVERSAP
jgi:hypothetical protein